MPTRFVRSLTVLLLLLTVSVSAQARQELDAIRSQVEAFLNAHYRGQGIERVTITIGRLDPRLKLAACASELDMTVKDEERRGGNITVHTRCPGPSRWALYVPAEVSVYRQVAVASRSLGRGQRLGPGDVTLAVRDTGQLRQGFVTHKEAAVGMALRRPLQSGEPIRLAQLEKPTVVERGDQVRLRARTGTITVDTKGTALSDGRVGDQVRVRNDRSERVVRGRVLAAGVVEVIL